MLLACSISQAQEQEVSGADSVVAGPGGQRGKVSTFMSRVRGKAPVTASGLFRDIDSALNAVDSVEVLNLRDQNLTQLPPQVASMKRLRVVDLSGNKFTSFPEVLLNIPGLTSIDLSNNQIKTVPVGIGKLDRLTKLILKNTGITTLPAALGACKELSILDVSANPLVSLPVAELVGLPKLKSIQLSGGKEDRK